MKSFIMKAFISIKNLYIAICFRPELYIIEVYETVNDKVRIS